MPFQTFAAQLAEPGPSAGVPWEWVARQAAELGVQPQDFAQLENWVSGFSGSWETLAAALVGAAVLIFLSRRLFGRQPRNAGHGSDVPEQAAVHAPGSSPALHPGNELRAALGPYRAAFWAILVFGAVSNILMLTGAVYMLENYDRVIPSRSVPTLVALSVLAAMLFASQGILEAIRGKILVRVGAALDGAMNKRILGAILQAKPSTGPRTDGLQPVRSLDAVRAFLGSSGPAALLDLPWLPFYIGIIYLFHPVLGAAAIAGTILLVSLTILTELRTRAEVRAAAKAGQRRMALAEAGRRNRDAVLSMGMSGRLLNQYAGASESLVAHQTRVSDISGSLGSSARMLRMVLQSAMLGLGAWLVIHGDASGGVIVASSILVGRALAPVDQAIAQWKNFVAAREGWRNLTDLLSRSPAETQRMSLPAPKEQVRLEQLSVAEPGGRRLLVRDITLELTAGSALAIIGPSGSGKSTLSRAMAGAWPAAAGRIRFDGAAYDQWPSEQIGMHIGYLPQDVELFAGSVAENIARLDPNPDPAAVIAAATEAGCHKMILDLRDGYQTQIGEGGSVLSGGQRQRIALARALYRSPFLVVLDEPNSHLDADGDRALQAAIRRIKERGGIAVVVSHRPNIMQTVDLVLLMKEGRPAAFGPKEEVLAKVFPSAAWDGQRPNPVSSPEHPAQREAKQRQHKAGHLASAGSMEHSA